MKEDKEQTDCVTEGRYLHVKQFILRNKWAGPIIGFIVGVILGTGALWQFLDYRLKSNAALLEQTKFENSYYERLVGIQKDVSSQIVDYIQLRDRYFANRDDYKIQNQYFLLMNNLAAVIEQYNRLAAKLALLERRKVRWFVLPVPPIAPANVRIETSPDGKQFLVSDPAILDPLQAKVTEDMKAIIESYEGNTKPVNEAKPN